MCVHCWRSRRWLRDRFFWRMECGVESPRLWSTRDQGSNIAWSEKKAKKPFPSVNNVFALRRPTFTFKYHPNWSKQKLKLRFASISSVNLHNLSWTKSLWISKIKTISQLHQLYLYPLSKQSFPNYSQNTRRSSLRISRSIPVSQTSSKQVLLHSFRLRLPVERDVKYVTRY